MRSAYSQRPTWLHGVSAGLKLAGLCVVGTLLFAVGDLAWLAAACAATVAMVASLRPGWGGVRGLAILLGVLLAFHALAGSWRDGVQAAFRLAILALLGMALTLTTRPDDLVAVIEALLAPLRRVGLRPDRLALAFALMLRFVEVFLLQWRRLDEAHRARTGRRGNWRLLPPLVLQVFATAERVADALSARLGG